MQEIKHSTQRYMIPSSHDQKRPPVTRKEVTQCHGRVSKNTTLTIAYYGVVTVVFHSYNGVFELLSILFSVLRQQTDSLSGIPV